MTPAEESAAVKVITKNTIREQIYEDFDAKGLEKIWQSFKPHIPKFSAAPEAAAKIVELPEYQNASSVLTKTGTTLEPIRLKALQDKKKLLVPIPTSSKTGMLFMVEPPDETDEKALRRYVTRTGLSLHSKTVPADGALKVDIVVLGSVAVDRQGRRIGSGRDYFDLECAIMAQKGMITENTIVVTVVHDAQVIDSLPEELFGEHDVRVKVILTPTETIRIDGHATKPSGIVWKLLTKRMLRLLPVIKEMYEQEIKDGGVCELKVEERNAERKARPRKTRQFKRGKPSEEKSAEGTDGAEAVVDGVDGVNGVQQHQPRRRSYWSSKRRAPKSAGEGEAEAREAGAEGGEADKAENTEKVTQNGDSSRPTKGNRFQRTRRTNGQDPDGIAKTRRLPYRHRYPIDFSLRVSNIASNVRVRDLKNALAECHVKPAEIRWKGSDGFAVLHFVREGRPETDTPASMDGVITSLRGLKVAAAEGDSIVVEPYNRVTRIEVTNEVTAV